MNVMTNTRNQKPLLVLSDTARTRPNLSLKSIPCEQDDFTVKIVLTMTMKARDAEHARILAQHVAAFVPEDADRLTEAFSPVLAASDDFHHAPTSQRLEQTRSITEAEVVAIVPGIRG
jgi:hypothetical protein